MSTGNNNLLLAVRTAENALKMTKHDTREQLGKAQLNSINTYCNNVLKSLRSFKEVDLLIVEGLIVGVSELLTNLYTSIDFVQTDTETKEYIYGKLNLALDNLYIKAAEYYRDNDFNYDMRLDPILHRIVERKLSDDLYYFD